MTMYEQDPDVVRWGLHLIDVCSITNNGSPETVTCYENDFCQTESVNEGFVMPIRSFVENDEVIAHTLQEEYARLASAESSGSASNGKLHQKESVLAQDWLGPSNRNMNYGLEQPNSNFQINQEDGCRDKAVLQDLEELCIENEDQDMLPEIEDDSALDGELGKRLNQMVPLPLYELVELQISGDGNCQFRSLSDQIYRSPKHHKLVREQVVNQLSSRPDLYENYVPMGYSDYLKKMRKNGEWGDHITLQAAADWYGIRIFVITSFKDTCYIEILPLSLKSERTIFLSFWAEVHYNSIYPLGELPPVKNKKKKHWWQ